MNDAQEHRFACPTCGRLFYWREANVGRLLRCHVCGQQVEVPPEPLPAAEVQPETPSSEGPLPPLAEAAVEAAEELEEQPTPAAVVVAFLRAHWGKTLLAVVVTTALYLWSFRIAPVRRHLAQVQAALRRDTHISDLTLAIPLLPLCMPARVQVAGTTTVSYGARKMFHRVEPPYTVRLEARGVFLPSFGSAVIFSGRVEGDYDTAARTLTLAGDLQAPRVTGVVHFELTTLEP